mgnify:FL=1
MADFIQLNGPGGRRLVRISSIESIRAVQQDARGRYWVHLTATSGQEYTREFGSMKDATDFVESLVS